MGIVNVTPDSFSDGGKYLSVELAIEHALRLAAEGADVLDIGGESTRPYSTPVSAEEELRRVLPVLRGVRERVSIPLSIDTSKALVAREALAAGAEIINDVTGLLGDPLMVETALETGAALCVMHMRGTPQTMQDNPLYENVVEEIAHWLLHRRTELESLGIEGSKIAVDPGIGFGKTHDHNLTLLRNCHRFRVGGGPLIVGHSRKGFIGKVLGDKNADRTWGSVGVALALARQGVSILRVHDVGPVRQALVLFDTIWGGDHGSAT